MDIPKNTIVSSSQKSNFYIHTSWRIIKIFRKSLFEKCLAVSCTYRSPLTPLFKGGIGIKVHLFKGGIVIKVHLFKGGIGIKVHLFKGGIGIKVPLFKGDLGGSRMWQLPTRTLLKHLLRCLRMNITNYCTNP